MKAIMKKKRGEKNPKQKSNPQNRDFVNVR